MATRQRAQAARSTTRTRRAAPEPVEEAPAPRRRGRPAKAAPAAASKPARDVTQYAGKEPTDYHKAYATWIVRHVGYKPSEAASLKEAFLMGVSIATAARPAFMDSEYLEDWRAKTGVTKRGPKGNAEADEAPPARTRRAKAAPEPEPEDDDDDEFDDDDEVDEDDDDFDDDDESDEDDDDEDDDEPEPAPVKSRRGARSAKAAPAKATGRRASKTDDDDFLF